MNWYGHIRKYVWHEESTPYLTPADQLTLRQARRELFAYSVFVGSVFAFVATAGLVALSRAPGLDYLLWAAVGLAVLGACVALALAGSRLGAWVVAGAPALILLHLAVAGFGPTAGSVDKLLMVGFLLLLLRYGVRVVRIAHHQPPGAWRAGGRAGE